MLFDEIRLQAEVKKHLADVVCYNWKQCVPAKLIHVGTSFPMEGILLLMLKLHIIIDRGVNVGNNLERGLVIRMEVETLDISNHG